ncbi:hypothetical protein D3C71_804190 [compost metagenome]
MAVGNPLTIEQQLPVEHQRAGDFHHHFVPFADVFARRPELIGDARAPDHGQTLVHQQQFTVVAVEVADPAPPAQTIVETQLHPGGHQPLAQGQGEGEAAVIIEQAAHPHTALGGLHQGLDHGFGAGARLHQIQLQFNLFFGAGNRYQHAREKLRTVDQQFEVVAFTPRKNRSGHVSAP